MFQYGWVFHSPSVDQFELLSTTWVRVTTPFLSVVFIGVSRLPGGAQWFLWQPRYPQSQARASGASLEFFARMTRSAAGKARRVLAGMVCLAQAAYYGIVSAFAERHLSVWFDCHLVLVCHVVILVLFKRLDNGFLFISSLNIKCSFHIVDYKIYKRESWRMNMFWVRFNILYFAK